MWCLPQSVWFAALWTIEACSLEKVPTDLRSSAFCANSLEIVAKSDIYMLRKLARSRVEKRTFASRTLSGDRPGAVEKRSTLHGPHGQRPHRQRGKKKDKEPTWRERERAQVRERFLKINFKTENFKF